MDQSNDSSRNSLVTHLSGLLSNQGEKSIHLYFIMVAFQKKVLKYGTPKPSAWGEERAKSQQRSSRAGTPKPSCRAGKEPWTLFGMLPAPERPERPACTERMEGEGRCTLRLPLRLISTVIVGIIAIVF